MAAKQGVHPKYYRLLDGRHDLLVDAEVSAVSEVVVTVPEMVYAEALRVEPDCAAGADAAQKSQVRIFRLPGQQWTQVFCPIKPYRSFDLGELVSKRLATRCLQIEVTDDAWGGHALFDRGAMQELALYCTGYDLRNVCPRFSLPVPEMDEEDIYDSADFFHSELRPDQTAGDLASLARILGLWVDAGEASWDPLMQVERLDLLYPS